MHRILRVAAILAVFVLATLAWLSFGGVLQRRSQDQRHALDGRVAELWGVPQHQHAPQLQFEWTTLEAVERTEAVEGKVTRIVDQVRREHAEARLPASTDVRVAARSDPRRKGLIWYSFYDLDFSGRWTYRHDSPLPGRLALSFSFPDPGGLYDGFRFAVNGRDVARELRPTDGQVRTSVPVEPGQEVVLEIAYRTRGTDEWRYVPALGVANLENFTLAATTDFRDIDFPGGTLSPTSKTQVAGGWSLDWRFEQVVTGHSIGITMPQRVQPGELASSLAFSAPISLLFFFLLLVVRTNLRGIDVHPVNYLFLAAAFFAFHLLFGYLVDHVTVIVAFAVSSAVSILLVLTYLRLVVSIRFAFVEALSQLVFLVGFSLAHFWEGYTGLTVTVLSILTLFVLMQLTGRVRWSSSGEPAPLPA